MQVAAQFFKLALINYLISLANENWMLLRKI